MESKLTLSEFRARLKNNTEIGSLKVKLNLFRLFPKFGGIKPFYGLFDDASFRLTINSTTSPTHFIVKGNYKNVNNVLKVNYVVESNNRFQSLWVEYSPVIGIIGINIFFLFFARGLRRASTIVNLFLLFVAFYSRYKEERKRKKLEQKFIRIFEIKK
ncbi:hypothetical protein IRZ71_03820 [Flavobacterium sp. ANB]|uniref:hypothetical protein n=1 Tax=unclassified Flavobacterium TaxID=196869 RepID=UPI0012BA0577|nr:MULTISPECIES: hypothetical protein [unclassified Flavobacterium]MBF4515451.1 hypothetical protein [Flavobacterium sp. ANB]MTD68454.1 hypothetical protein [Flavobacterium sp. LC2016-13]